MIAEITPLDGCSSASVNSRPAISLNVQRAEVVGADDVVLRAHQLAVGSRFVATEPRPVGLNPAA